MKKILKKYRHEFILGILICIYIVYFTTASFLRYDNFYTGQFDLGNMDQTVWNTVNGRIFQTSGNDGTIISRASVHADFLLILLSPLYSLWNHPKTLLLTQTVVLSFGAIFVFLISKEIIKNKNFALIFGFLYLANPLVQYTNLYDFHAVTLATTLLLASFYFLIKHRHVLLVIFLILSGISKEQVWLTTSVFGLYLLFANTKKVKLLGLGIMLSSIAIFYYLIWHLIPESLGGQHFALSYFSNFGNTPMQVVLGIISSPQKLFSTIIEVSHLRYLGQLFMSAGFISFLSPAYLVFAFPDLLIALLSSNPQLYQIYYQYTAVITPFIFISAIFAVKNIIKWFPKIPRSYIAIYLLAFALVSAYFLGPLPGSKVPNLDWINNPYLNRKTVENFLSAIPERYSIAATNNLGSHISHRQTVYTIPVGIDKADIVMFLLNSRSNQLSFAAQEKMVNNLRQDKNYTETFRKDDFVVFKKQDVLL